MIIRYVAPSVKNGELEEGYDAIEFAPLPLLKSFKENKRFSMPSDKWWKRRILLQSLKPVGALNVVSPLISLHRGNGTQSHPFLTELQSLFSF